MSVTEELSYAAGSKILYWIIAFIVILLLSLSFFLEDVPEQYAGLAYMIHKSLGLTVLWLMIFRLIWIWHRRAPPLPLTVPIWQRNLARAIQYSLYLLLFAMPLSGWIMSVAANKIPVYFGLFSVPLPLAPNKSLAMLMNQTHNIIAWILIAFVTLHIVGALKHYFINKDKVLQRMLP